MTVSYLSGMECIKCEKQIPDRQVRIRVFSDFIDVTMYCPKCKTKYYSELDQKDFK